ncbi:hypothetical protein P280DRAFT_474009 [Massarina eburnea CBS 473.64]|uniref:Pentacotripeptide-repeat region of PRORP domain-containing protein n=1 Tax=Massarina eburnea CBS 473.64 TaxID=1395130 RepID=A0A6A6RIN1_9PLEO|nr:hypothetical protein P280DRAFT_474009 [Massarina eburnea CBS 473.64]
MPRACVPNARFLAHADSPLLPFLAPRVFAEASFLRKTDGERTQKEKETETERGGGRGGKIVGCAGRFEGRPQGWSGAFRPGFTQGHAQSPLSVTSKEMLLSKPSGANVLRSAMDMRYADISSIARRQLRSYSTRPPDDSKLNVQSDISSKAKRTSRRQRKHTSSKEEAHKDSKHDIHIWKDTRVSRHVARRRKRGEVAKAPSEPHVKEVPIEARAQNRPPTHQLVFNIRRLRKLKIIIRRIRQYRRYNSKHDSDILQIDGRYRSLRRQHFNQVRLRSQTFDLAVSSGRLEDPRFRLRVFASLDRYVYPGLRRRTLDLWMRHDPQCPTWTSMLFNNDTPSTVEDHDEKQVLSNWMNFDENTRNSIWPYLLLYLLHRQPGHALRFMRVLVHQPGVERVDSDMLADAFEHLSRTHKRTIHQDRSWDRKSKIEESWNVVNFIPTFTHFIRNYCHSDTRHVCTQDLLYTIPDLAEIEDLKEVFNLVEEKGMFMLTHTLLHYANTFAKAGEIQCALRCLGSIRRRAKSESASGSIANMKRFRWTCALILRQSAKHGRDYHETTAIVSALVNLGIRLDTLLYNVIIHNSMDAGDYSTAFKVYNNLGDNGLRADKYTYSILLHGCTMTDDPHKFVDFAEYCAHIAKETRDPWLASDYLYYLYACRKLGDKEDRRQREESFDHISKVYGEFFSTNTLRLINPLISPVALSDESGPDASAPFKPMEPLPMALYLILQMEIQSVAASNTEVWSLYLRFRQLVRSDTHPALNKLAGNPVIWNAFLLAFSRNKQFQWASQLVKDMTDHNPQPNVYTWNIFMQGFFKAEQTQVAERVYDIMRARGVDPDRFTYRTLLRGYVRSHHVEKIGEAMEFVDNEEQMDPALVQALGRIHDRERLMTVLERSQARKDEKMRVMHEKYAERQKRRWQKPFQTEEEVEAPVFGSAFKGLEGFGKGKRGKKT